MSCLDLVHRSRSTSAGRIPRTCKAEFLQCGDTAGLKEFSNNSIGLLETVLQQYDAATLPGEGDRGRRSEDAGADDDDLAFVVVLAPHLQLVGRRLPRRARLIVYEGHVGGGGGGVRRGGVRGDPAAGAGQERTGRRLRDDEHGRRRMRTSRRMGEEPETRANGL
jgi:hypothetical protein